MVKCCIVHIIGSHVHAFSEYKGFNFKCHVFMTGLFKLAASILRNVTFISDRYNSSILLPTSPKRFDPN